MGSANSDVRPMETKLHILGYSIVEAEHDENARRCIA